jgi:acid-sensing ion channel, other
MAECNSNATLKYCGCVQYHQIRESSTKLCNNFNDVNCYNRVQVKVYDEDSELFEACGCLTGCNSIEYNLKMIYGNDKRVDGNDNVTRSSIAIYFGDDEFIVLKRYATFGTVTLLSNIGGLLGLFLGVSALTVIEIFYFFILRLADNLWLARAQ